MTLKQIIEDFDRLEHRALICAKRPWTEATEALAVVLDDEDDPLPEHVQAAGYEYFIDVPVAKEVLEVFGDRKPTVGEKVRLLLHYAEFDAYPDWVYDR